MRAVFVAGLTELGPGIINLCPETTLDEEERIKLALKIIPAGGMEGDFVVVSFKKVFKAAAIIVPVPAFDESQDVRGSYAAFGFLLDKNVNSLPYQDILKEITEVCKKNNILSVPILKNLCTELYTTLKESRNLNLKISYGVEVKLPFNPLKTTGETLRDAMKRL
ncbi:MAG: hypothetical protein ACFFFG_04830 [Candidatus Thorarchaeota archaeon]